MKKNKFISLGINTFFDAYDKSRLCITYSQFVIHGWRECIVSISNLFAGEDPLTHNRDPNEANDFRKMQDKNLKSFKARLNLLGQSEFCAWVAKELDKDKQFAYGIYSLIESGDIKENENLSLLKEAICNSLTRNNFKRDINKPYPNSWKEFVSCSAYDERRMIMTLKNENNQDKKIVLS